MRSYSGRDRIIAAFRRQYTDRVPVTLVLGPYSAKLAGVPLKVFLTKPDKLAESVVKAHEVLGPDSVVVYGDAYLEAEAVGSEIEFPEEAVTHLKRHILEEKSTLAKLNIPDPKRDKRLPYYLEACERVTSVLKDPGIAGLLNGPWNIAVALRGAQELIYDTMDDPDFVHELMRFTTEVAKTFGDAQRETGVGVNVADAAASCSLISPNIYAKFVKPYEEELITYFKQKKARVTIHICGYIDPIMEDLVASGADAISIDGPSSLKKLVEVSQKKAVVIGNVPTELFVGGTKEQIEAAVKACIETAADGSAYILSSGCEIPYNASLETIKYFMNAGHQHGSEFISMLRESKPHLFE